MSALYVFTGAGISAPSGIQTWRGSNGIWEGTPAEEVATLQAWYENPGKVNSFLNNLKDKYSDAEPNDFHHKVAELQSRYGSDRVKVITQNVDNLFEKAGCTDVLHLHGNFEEYKCMECHQLFKADFCPKHGSDFIKYNIVLFGESAPNYKLLDIYLKTIGKNDIWITSGTSGNVINLRSRSPKAKRIHWKRERFWNCFYYLNVFDGYHENLIPVRRNKSDENDPKERYFIESCTTFLSKIYPRICELMDS